MEPSKPAGETSIFKYWTQKIMRREAEPTSITDESDMISIISNVEISKQPQTPTNSHYSLHNWSNAICTTKYTWWNFFPYNFFTQITRPSNFYFCMIGFLQLVPVISDSGGYPTTWIPLSFVIGLTMIRDLYELIRKSNQDSEENERKCTVIDANGTENVIPWKHLYPGCIVKISQNENIPVDLILMSSSNADGAAYIQTIKIDGESNLKEKTIPSGLCSLFDDYSTFKSKTVYMQITPPNEKLEVFRGEGIVTDNSNSRRGSTLRGNFQKCKNMIKAITNRLDSENKSYTKFFCQWDNFLMRGASLRNTAYIIGMAIYTGQQTRIFKNTISPKLKYSKLQKTYEGRIFKLFLCQTVLCLISTLLYTILSKKHAEKAEYLALEEINGFAQFLKFGAIGFGRWLLLLSYLIPIALLVQQEVARSIAALFLSHDTCNSDKPLTSDQYMQAQSLATIEDLGCITDLITDKTGTLTKNLMQFAVLSIAGDAVHGLTKEGEEVGFIPSCKSENFSPNYQLRKASMEKLDDLSPSEFQDFVLQNEPFSNFDAKAYCRHLENLDATNTLKSALSILVLTLCHSALAVCTNHENGNVTQDKSQPADSKSIVATRNNSGNSKNNNSSIQLNKFSVDRMISLKEERFYTQYEASSPDEIAFLCGVRTIGAVFVGAGIQANSRSIALTTKVIQKMFLQSFTNDSSDETMVPIIDFRIVEKINFDFVRKRMSLIVEDPNKQLWVLVKGADTTMLEISHPKYNQDRDSVEDHVLQISSAGYRTLVLGVRQCTMDEVEEYRNAIEKAYQSPPADMDSEVHRAISILERDLWIVGCTGVEDRLQDDVKETLEQIKDADIRIWIATGDKLETAITVSKSCGLLSDQTFHAIIDETSNERIRAKLTSYLENIFWGLIVDEWFETDEILRENHVTDGDELSKRLKLIDDAIGNITKHQVFIKFFKQRLGFLKKLKFLLFWKNKRVARQSIYERSLTEVVRVTRQTETPSGDDKNTQKLKIFKVMNNYLKRCGVQYIRPQDRFGIGKSTVEVNGSEAIQRAEIGEVEKYNETMLTITGRSLSIALEDPTTAQLLMSFANLCSVVTACRVSPKQKSQLITKFREFKDDYYCSLAIGDGANDVSMILAADVGVGIKGSEGLQAMRSADFAVAKFSQLKQLLFVHGRDSLRKNSFLLHHMCWKNSYYGLCDFYYGFFSLFSAVDIYNSWLKQLFNILFSSFPIVCYAAFDRDIPWKYLHKATALYSTFCDGKTKNYPGSYKFWMWILYSHICAIVTIVCITYGLSNESLTSDGKIDFDVPGLGATVYLIVNLTANIVIMIYSHTWHWILPLIVCLSIGVWYLALFLCPLLAPTSCLDLQGLIQDFNRSPIYHILLFSTLMLVLYPLVLVRGLKQTYFPSLAQVYRECKYAPGDQSVTEQRRRRITMSLQKAENLEWHGFAFSEEEKRVRRSIKKR